MCHLFPKVLIQNNRRKKTKGEPADPGSSGKWLVCRQVMTFEWHLTLLLYCSTCFSIYNNTHLMALCPGYPGVPVPERLKPVRILLKQETVGGSGISWAICKSAPHHRQIPMPAPHHSIFYRPEDLPATQLTVSKYWRQKHCLHLNRLMEHVMYH